MKYETEPTASGYYWMRWRWKYQRRSEFEVVWVSQDVWRTDRNIRVGPEWWPEWCSVARFPNATFYGPGREAPEPQIECGIFCDQYTKLIELTSTTKAVTA